LGLRLTDEQWAAVSSDLSPAVIVAGAGSGKTTSMAARVAWLVGSGLARPDAILGLTFTTKATAQLLASMRRSLGALVAEGIVGDEGPDGAPLGEPQVLTYHAFGARILAEHGIRLGREPSSTLLTDGARQQLAYRVVCRSTLPLAALGRSPVALTSSLLSLDDELTELAVTPADLRQFDDALAADLLAHSSLQRIGETVLATARERAVLAELVEEWRAEKAARDVLDFADQIRLAGEIVEQYPDVVRDLRERFGVVLLDEYQDTSIAQRVLLQRVFGEGHPVLAVGDPCQAIYGWRGASVDNIDRFGVHFPAGEQVAARFTLSQNRRSGPAILEIANRTSTHLREVHAGVRPLSAGDNGKGSGVVSCALFDTYAEEQDWVVDQVIATRQARGSSTPVAWRDIAILAATSADLVAVDAALRRRGVPTQLVGAAALLAQPAVVEARAMLEVLHDPSANPAFVRLAAGPRWRIGARDLAALGDRAAHLAGGRSRSAQESIEAALDDAVAGTDTVESVSLTEALDDLGDPAQYSPEAVHRFGALAAELHDLRAHAGEPLAEFVLRVVRTTGLEVEATLAADTNQPQALQAFVDLAAEFTEPDGRLTLGAFLSRLKDAERFDVAVGLDVAGPIDAVQLLTVHKAKGLEFAYVFVPFVAKGAFPGGRGRAQWPTSPSTVPWPLRDDCTDPLASFPMSGEPPRDKHHKAYQEVLRGLGELEDQRLAYVAFTRAERGLVVSGHWWGPTQATRRGPAAFLATVHEACLDGFGTVAHWAPAPADDAVNPQALRTAEPVAWPAPLDSAWRARLLEAAQAVRNVGSVQPSRPGVDSDADGAGERARIAEWDVLASALLEEARARQAAERRVVLPGSVSASVLMRALAEPESLARDLTRPMPRPPAPAARRGTQFHAWVETRFGQQSLIDLDDLPGAADADIETDEQLAELKAAFELSPYAQRSPVAIEAPFALVLGGRVVHGRIDAVFEGTATGRAEAGRYEVVDWKTGSSRGVDARQLAIYRLAWAQLAGVDVAEVSAAFVMVGSGEVIRPDTSAEVAELLALSR
jgi:DNA helicase-2/ATP-dependent DNA helicase PcrA